MLAKEYQNKIYKILQSIFGDDLVEKEWNSTSRDSHTSNHKLVYAPKVDLAVGPFNDYLCDLDLGVDQTNVMKQHPFTKRLYDKCLRNRGNGNLEDMWNRFSRCYLSIELEFSGSLKHMMGSIINTSATGSLGLIVTTKKGIKKIDRLVNYVKRLEDMEIININYLNNLVVFEEKEFLNLLINMEN